MSIDLRRVLTKDMRAIYLIIIILIALGPVIGFPTTLVSPFVERAYKVVDALQPGDLVLFVGHFRSVVYPETWAALQPVFTHIINKGGKILVWATLEEAIMMCEILMNTYWGPDWRTSPDYGKKFIYLGYMPYTAGGIYTMGIDFKKLFPVDYKGTPLGDIPMTKDAKDAKDFALVVGICAPTKTFASYWKISYGTPCLGVEDVGSVAYFLDYWAAGLVEVVCGAKLGAEYEYLMKYPGISGSFMGSVFLMTSFVLIILVVNNFYILRRRIAKKEEAR